MYIRREMERTIEGMLGQFKVVLVTGARQVGKTTMLKEHLKDNFNYITMEDPTQVALTVEDPILFFQMNNLPLIIDEVQRVPELFQSAKFVVDQSREYGQIVLTGSQTYELMKGISESLAGRIGILEMSGLSLRELNDFQNNLTDIRRYYIPQNITDNNLVRQMSYRELWEHIQRGSMPELYATDIPWDRFWSSYVQAYLERDVRDLVNLKNERKFYNFLVVCAARTGELFNASSIAKDIDVDYKTVQSWVSILQASGIVRFLYPFWTNTSKSVTKTPKIYFMDTGLVCHLTRWNTPEQLCHGAAAGHIFETFVVSEVLKSYMNAGANLRDVWFYRDSKKREIDLVIQEGHVLHPVEIKTAATVKTDMIENFKCLEAVKGYKTGFGHVICQTPEPYFINRDVQAIPVWMI